MWQIKKLKPRFVCKNGWTCLVKWKSTVPLMRNTWAFRHWTELANDRKRYDWKSSPLPRKATLERSFSFASQLSCDNFSFFFFFFFFLVFLHATQIFDGELSEVVERRLQRIQREQTLQGNWVVASIFLLHHWSALQSFRSKWMITA